MGCFLYLALGDSGLVAFVGFILGYGYTGPPIGYKYLGLGEVGVFFSTIAASEFRIHRKTSF